MTTLMPHFHIAKPRDVEAAIAARRAHLDSSFLAGGTDLLINMLHGLTKPTWLIDLSDISELAGIAVTETGVRIGAGVTIAALAHAQVLAERYRALVEASEAIAAPGHRVMGTIGGNLCLATRCLYYNQSEWWRRANGFCLKHHGDICHVAPLGQHCHAAYTGDLAPALLVLGAEVEIAGPHARRRIPLGELYVEDGRAHLQLATEEIIVAVHLPLDPPPSTYAKVRTRKAIDYPLAGVAVALATASRLVTVLRIGISGTNSRPFLLAGADTFLGKPIDENVLQQIDRLVQKQVQPMRTTIASAHYRRIAAAALARRLVAALDAG